MVLYAPCGVWDIENFIQSLVCSDTFMVTSELSFESTLGGVIPEH